MLDSFNNPYYSSYEIKNGDTLYGISKKYNVNTKLLAELNGLDLEDYIYPGQILLVPKKDVSYYITKTGDTLKTVSDIFDVNINCLECIFCQDYDNYIDEYLINYIGIKHKKKAENEIMENGLQYYFDINKINRNNYEEQYIYDIQTSQKIAIVININANKKKEIKESINSIITKYCEEALSE